LQPHTCPDFGLASLLPLSQGFQGLVDLHQLFSLALHITRKTTTHVG
jgi:hypothetical protein